MIVRPGKISVSECENEAGQLDKRRPYKSPSIIVYGTVAQFTNGTLSVGTDAGFNNSKQNKQSDPALKEAIVRIGSHPLGFGLYLFTYKAAFQNKCGHGRQFGVMADEVFRIIPDAVGRDEDGYLTVNYERLGIVRH